MQLDDPFDGIMQCSEHTQNMQEGCPQCESEFTVKNAVLQDIQEIAQTHMKTLQASGIRPPVDLLASIRLELLIEVVLQDRNRVHFEVESARRFTKALAEGVVNARTASLHNPTPDLTVAKRMPGRG